MAAMLDGGGKEEGGRGSRVPSSFEWVVATDATVREVGCERQGSQRI